MEVIFLVLDLELVLGNFLMFFVCIVVIFFEYIVGGCIKDSLLFWCIFLILFWGVFLYLFLGIIGDVLCDWINDVIVLIVCIIFKVYGVLVIVVVLNVGGKVIWFEVGCILVVGIFERNLRYC